MVVKVYISRLSGNKEIKRKQDFVTSVLTNRKIPFEEIDISDPLHVSEKNFMREHSPPAGSDPSPLPPQIFNDDVYCGDYDAFFLANENVELHEFLQLDPEINSGSEQSESRTEVEAS